MASQQDTRQRLVQAALKLFASRGYYNTSVDDILKECQCTRGVLYYHFSSKEELGYAAIDEAIRLLVEEGSASHMQGNEHPIDRMVKALDALPNVTPLEMMGTSATDISLRMATVHEGFRQRLRESTGTMVEGIEEVVRRGVADGQILGSVDPDRLAHLFVVVGMGIQFSRLLWEREAIWEDARSWLKEYLSSLRN